MTRERAIDLCQAIDKYLCVGNPIWDVEEIHDAMSMAIEALKAQSITLDNISNAYENGYQQGKFEAQQWIPVSDRLPEKNGEYLVTVGKDSRFAFNGEATVYEDYFQFLCQWDDCGEDVIAWMEMPEPYKGE